MRQSSSLLVAVESVGVERICVEMYQTTVVRYVVLCWTMHGPAVRLLRSDTGSSTGQRVIFNGTSVVINRTTHGPQPGTTVVHYMVINRNTRGPQPDNAWSSTGLPWSSTGLPWSTTWSSTGLHVVLNRTFVVIYRTTVVLYVVNCWTTRGHPHGRLPDYRGHLHGHLPDYAWSSTGMLWSSMWSSARLPWSSAWSSGDFMVISWTASAPLIWNCHL